MLRSMTGFGRGEDTIGGRHIVFEIKSVNHKYFEFNSRIPRGYLFLEDKLKAYIQGKISRGKVDVFLQIETLEETDVQVLVNHSLASAYVTALQELKERYQLPDEPSLALLSKYSDIFSVHKAPEDEDAVWEAVRQVADQAIASFLKMREAEGARLKADILEKAGEIVALVDQVERHTPETVEHYRERLKAKIEELLQDNRFDEQRVLTEVAIFADKVAVDEETVRLRSHFQQLQRLVDSDGPVGRKIDFLVQEMNRRPTPLALNPSTPRSLIWWWISKPSSKRSGSRCRMWNKGGLV